MSVYNGGRALEDSVRGIREQSFGDFEFIIVDDASNDGSSDYLEAQARADTRIRLLRNERNMGLTQSLNRAFANSTADLVARQDADDVSAPQRFACQIEYLRTHPDVGLVGAWYQSMDVNGMLAALHRPPCDDLGIRWTMLFNNAFCHSAVMFRRELAAVDPWLYDPSRRYAQDFEAWSRLLKRTRGANIGTQLVFKRAHAGNLSWRFKYEQQAVADLTAIGNIQATSAWRPDDAAQLRRLRQMNIAGAAALNHPQSACDVDCYFSLLRDFIGGASASRRAFGPLLWDEIRKFVHPAQVRLLSPPLRRAVVVQLLRTTWALCKHAA